LHTNAVGSTELSICLRVVQTLVLYALCEHQLGHATRISVSAQGRDFSVADNGRGHAIARTVQDAPYLDFIYEHLAFPYCREASPPVQLQGLGMSLLNQLCSVLEVTVRKPTATLRIRFEDGVRVSHTVTDEANAEPGNTVSGTVNSTLTPEPLDRSALSGWLLAVQQVNPELKLTLNARQLRGVAGGA